MVPGVAEWGDVTVRAEPVDAYSTPDVSREAYLDARSLDGSLEVRAPRPGDRLRPFGAPGTRKLQDVLVDLRVPAAERARVPLVTCDGRIVWVGGLLLAEEGRITERTTALVRLSVERRLGHGGDGDPAGEGKGGRG
jgi:tRNA(Ile)-lysidine synthase